MAGNVTCRTCGQANGTDSEYCVRCGEKLPDPSSTQLVGAPGSEQEYPWEPPAEWDPGELPPTGGQQQTWVGRTPDQSGWNAPGTVGAHPSNPSTPWPGQVQTPPPPPYPGAGQPAGGGSSKKPLFIGAGAVVVIAAVVAVILVATGGSSKKKGGGGGTSALNGVQNQSGPDALTTARVALRGAKSVHLTGTVPSGSQKIRLDITLAGADTAGTLTINNNDVQLIKIGDAVYIKGDPDFLKQYAGGDSSVVGKLNGKWLKAKSTSDFDDFTLDGFANTLKDDSSAKINQKVTQETLDGKPVVIVSQSDGSRLTIANTGTPYPLALSAKDATQGQISFSDYNKATTIEAPTDFYDASATSADIAGTYDCVPPSGSSGGGILTLKADQSYTLSGGTAGGFWGASGTAVAFNSGTIDGYMATYESGAGVTTLALKGTGADSNVSYTCTKQ